MSHIRMLMYVIYLIKHRRYFINTIYAYLLWAAFIWTPNTIYSEPDPKNNALCGLTHVNLHISVPYAKINHHFTQSHYTQTITNHVYKLALFKGTYVCSYRIKTVYVLYHKT